MFKRVASTLDFTLRNGLQVQLQGRLGVYEARGDLQLVVEGLKLAGEGALMERFTALKAKLAAQGLFDQDRKRSIPQCPRQIGVVTSLGAAALHDVCTALRRRVAHIPVVIAPASVQGPEAVPQLIEALERLQKVPSLDVILLVRGGGSMEDLWAFNEEALVKSVAQSRIPVISGVGHETDFTLCDFAADLRAPTPTAAAELCATARNDWLASLGYYTQRIPAAVQSRLEKWQQELDFLSSRLRKPSHFISLRENQLDRVGERLANWKINQQSRYRGQLDVLHSRLEALSPQRVLERGYALLTDHNGVAVSKVDQLKELESLHVQLQDGIRSIKIDAS
jgi:exodeoxyribonuclease VII large subunit